MTIEAERLTVHRLGRVVLQDVSLHIDDGQCVSIIGPNGAGKSTLMAAVLDLLPAESGTIRIGGNPIGGMSRRDIARRVAYVPQIHEGYMGFAVRDVVETGRYAHVRPLDPLSEADHQAVAEAVAACRIEDLLDRTVDTLSGGERQKVWIAAALAQQSPAMFLDEPTNALDPAHQVELIRIMRGFASGDHTLLVICHDLNLPLALGGRVIALRQGRVAFDGEVEMLLDTDRLNGLYGADFALYHADRGQGVSIQLRT
jgi:iron complex transport system ATP-binding protein